MAFGVFKKFRTSSQKVEVIKDIDDKQQWGKKSFWNHNSASKCHILEDCCEDVDSEKGPELVLFRVTSYNTRGSAVQSKIFGKGVKALKAEEGGIVRDDTHETEDETSLSISTTSTTRQNSGSFKHGRGRLLEEDVPQEITIVTTQKKKGICRFSVVSWKKRSKSHKRKEKKMSA